MVAFRHQYQLINKKFLFRAKIPQASSSDTPARRLFSVFSVPLTPRLHRLLTRWNVYERLHQKYDVLINVETHRGYKCHIKGEDENCQRAVSEICRIKETTEEEFSKIRYLPFRLVDMLLLPFTNAFDWTAFLMSDSLPGYIIRKVTALAPRPAVTFHDKETKIDMMLDDDLVKYIVTFHTKLLTQICDRHNVRMSNDIKDGYAKFSLIGKGGQKAKKEIEMLMKDFQKQLRTENIAVTRAISVREIEILNKEFQEDKALLEYDKTQQCIHIIGHRRRIHHLKVELTARFGL